MRRRGVPALLLSLCGAARGAPGALDWHTNVEEAMAAADRSGRPILLYVGAAWCDACPDVERTLDLLRASAELDRLTLLRLDADHQADDTRRFQVTTIPALRLFTSLGHPVAGLAGPMTADDIRSLLEEHPIAAALDDPVLFAAGTVSAVQLERLLDIVCGEDPLAREAALQRLAELRDVAAPSVVERFAAGRLADRLACLELLVAWRAPARGLDPWTPETITAEALAALRDWAGALDGAADPGAGVVPSPEAVRAELERLVAAPTDLEAAVIRERLARVGPDLTAPLYAMLAEADTDHARTRLTAMRYRQTASAELSLRLPRLFEQLASPDAGVRHDAMAQLEGRAQQADRGLLVELFSASDPFLRETSLRLLRTIGGGTTADFLRLLDDPDANVRAAVLEQIAEAPQPGMVTAIAAYTERETQEDLLVHAVRVLGEIPEEESERALEALLDHDSWRVRAEAVVAYGAIAMQPATVIGRLSRGPNGVNTVVEALLPLLDDPEGFVVSRVVPVLCRQRATETVEAILAAVARFPEIAGDAVEQLALNRPMLQAAEPHLVALMDHESAAVRSTIAESAAALGVDERRPVLVRGMTDPDASVRRATIRAILEALSKTASATGGAPWRDPGPPAGGGRDRIALPKWIDELREPLEAMLESGDTGERESAALMLLGLGRREEAMEILASAVAAGRFPDAASSPVWFDGDDRRAWFDRLVALDGSGRVRGPMLTTVMTMYDDASAGIVWAALADPPDGFAERMTQFLSQAVLQGGGLASQRERTRESLVPYILDGEGRQPDAALALYALNGGSADVPVAVAEDADRPVEQRVLAAKAALLCERGAAASELAARWIGDPVLLEVALHFLARGPTSLGSLMGHDSEMLLFMRDTELFAAPRRKAITLDPPPPLDTELLLDLARSGDPDIAASAGYLLVAGGDRRGWDAVAALHAQKPDDVHAQRMLYRGASYLDDDELVPLLEAMSGRFSSSQQELAQFYWTIRNMTGPRAMALRKAMRDRYGAALIE